MFASDSTQIDTVGLQATNGAADSMQGNAALTATVIGKTDAAGGAAGNMRLSPERANAVRVASAVLSATESHSERVSMLFGWVANASLHGFLGLTALFARLGPCGARRSSILGRCECP